MALFIKATIVFFLAALLNGCAETTESEFDAGFDSAAKASELSLKDFSTKFAKIFSDPSALAQETVPKSGDVVVSAGYTQAEVGVERGIISQDGDSARVKRDQAFFGERAQQAGGRPISGMELPQGGEFNLTKAVEYAYYAIGHSIAKGESGNNFADSITVATRESLEQNLGNRKQTTQNVTEVKTVKNYRADGRSFDLTKVFYLAEDGRLLGFHIAQEQAFNEQTQLQSSSFHIFSK